MTPIEVTFFIGNIFFLIGTAWLIRQITMDRNVLKGFSTTGSLLTFLGGVCVLIAYGQMVSYINLGMSIPTVLFWVMAFVFSLRRKLKRS